MKQDYLCIVLLISLNIISLAILSFVFYSHQRQTILIQEGLQTYFSSNEFQVK
jgi:hypothetical protein